MDNWTYTKSSNSCLHCMSIGNKHTCRQPLNCSHGLLYRNKCPCLVYYRAVVSDQSVLFDAVRISAFRITTLWLFWLSCVDLTFFLDPTPRTNRWIDFHALWLRLTRRFHARVVLLRVRTTGHVIWEKFRRTWDMRFLCTFFYIWYVAEIRK